MKSGVTTSKTSIMKWMISLFSYYVCVAVAGGNEGQFAAVGEEEVHSRLDFYEDGQWGGWGDLQRLSKGLGGILPVKVLHKCICDSHRHQLTVLAVAVLLFLAAAWSHD